MSTNKEQITSQSISDLKKIVAHLRDPQAGCPWDKVQTHISLIPFLIEEAYEVANAIRENNDKDIQEELGDLLLQILLHSQIAEEENRFSLEDVITDICLKLVRRHPHVFGNKKADSVEAANEQWNNIKKLEKPTNNSKTPLCDNIRAKIISQPPISGALEISQKSSRAGFEWENVDEIWEKLHEELNEMKDALTKQDLKSAEEELGDIFFTLINISRWYNFNPEEALAGTNNRFLTRFSYIEESLNGVFSGISKAKLLELWRDAKESLKKRGEP